MVKRLLEKSFKNHKKLYSTVVKSVINYKLIEPNDRILVGVSGGKDSLTLLSLLTVLRDRSPVHFDFFAYTLDQGQPGFDRGKLEDHYKYLGVEYIFGNYDIYSVLQQKLDPGQTQCFLCSRIRRGIMYTDAIKHGATKIALGHHADDAAQTLLMNLFYTGRLASIPPKLRSDDGQNTVIRPLIEVSEKDIISYSHEMNLPVIPCSVCGSQEKLQRQRIKKLLESEEALNPKIKSSMKAALKNVQMRHLWGAGDFESENHVEIAEDEETAQEALVNDGMAGDDGGDGSGE